MLLSDQPFPIFTPQCYPIIIHCESTHYLPFNFLPTQLNDSLVEQRTSPTLHFFHQILIAMLSLKRHNLSLHSTNDSIIALFSHITIHQYNLHKFFSRFLYSLPFRIHQIPFIPNTIVSNPNSITPPLIQTNTQQVLNRNVNGRRIAALLLHLLHTRIQHQIGLR